MSTISMPQSPSNTTSIPEMSTPGSLFINRKSNFQTQINDFYHYKLEKLPSIDGYKSLPSKKRMAINMSLTSNKNEIDPYVHASNWLPRFKAQCRGYLARKRTEELRKKHDAVRIIQRAAGDFLNPLVQIFHTIRPTLNIIKMDELKKNLRECIFQIKKLNAERAYIESQLDEVDQTLDKSLSNNDNNCLSLEGRKSPNIFGKLSELKANANNDTFLKECLDLHIEGFDDIEVDFDPSTCQNSKVQSVYEKSDKLQIKIHEHQHRMQELINKIENYEKEIKDLRTNNSSLDSTSKLMKGLIHKHEIEKTEQVTKLKDLEERLGKITDERRNLLNKLKETENHLTEKTKSFKECTDKCEYLDRELEKKIKAIGILNQDKSNYEKKIKELEESLNYNAEIQQDLEANHEAQKLRMKDMKKRFQDQVKAVEEELAAEKLSAKNYIQDLVEQNDSLNEKVKQYESTIRRLERDITDSAVRDGSDEEIGFERERKLSLQLKSSQANNENLKEELKIMENSLEESKKRNHELESSLEESKEEVTEYRKQTERLKADNQRLKSSNNELELNLNRVNREKSNINQKLSQSKEANTVLEKEISKLKEELTIQNQSLNLKAKEIENLMDEIASLKKEQDMKISYLDRDKSDLQTQLEKANEKINQVQQELKEFKEMSKQELEEQKQFLEEKEMEQESTIEENRKHMQKIKQLQKRIEEYIETQEDLERKLSKMKEENKSLLEERDLTSPTDLRSMDFLNRESSMTSSFTSLTPGYQTLPIRRSGRR